MATPIGVWALGALVFFRASLASGFDKIMGNVGDARLIVLLHEHWIDVVRQRSSWTSPSFFYPQKGALGYSDTFVLNEIFYIPLRAAGLDPYNAFQWTLILMSLVGFIGMYAIGRMVLGNSILVSSTVALVFTFANNLFIKAGHPQLYSIYWVPAILLAALTAWSAQGVRLQIAWSAIAGLLSGLLIYSTFYVGWYLFFTAGLTGLVKLCLNPSRAELVGLFRLVRSRLPQLGGFAVGCSIALVPFFITYLPILRSNGGRSYSSVMSFAAEPIDLINVGRNNYLWGSVVRKLFSGDPSRLINVEYALAVTPLLLISVAGAGVLACTRWRRSPMRNVLLSLVIVSFLLWIMPVNFSFGSLWAIPWHSVPGAVAIRAINRLQIMAGLTASLALALALSFRCARDARSESRRRIPMHVGVSILLGLIVLEQLNLDRNSVVDRSEEQQFIVLAPDAPSSCSFFYIVDTSETQVPSFQSNIDAMIISQNKELPTLNGYSGQFPVGWALDPSSPAYLDGVRSWVTENNLDTSRLCSYDRSARVWIVAPLR